MEKLRQATGYTQQERLIDQLSRLWKVQADRDLVGKTIRALDARYALSRKIALEPGVAEIIGQMFGRLANSFGRLADIQNKRILDIACGSNTSQAPAGFYFGQVLGGMPFGSVSREYTALFEPWFCRSLFELGASPVGVDIGNLDNELFVHFRVDLGKPGALDFLTTASFDAIQDSRLFGSPEFTAQFSHQADRLKVAQEIVRQERRLLKVDGILIHSDALALVE